MYLRSRGGVVLVDAVVSRDGMGCMEWIGYVPCVMCYVIVFIYS